MSNYILLTAEISMPILLNERYCILSFYFVR